MPSRSARAEFACRCIESRKTNRLCADYRLDFRDDARCHTFSASKRRKPLDIDRFVRYNISCCGGVTQLARVVGSYPACHPFESDRRYHNKNHPTGWFLLWSCRDSEIVRKASFGNEAKWSSRHPFRCRCNRKDAVSDRRYRFSNSRQCGNHIDVCCSPLWITDPIASGVAYGIASHAIGTSHAIAKALACAVSSLSLTVAGPIAAVAFPPVTA